MNIDFPLFTFSRLSLWRSLSNPSSDDPPKIYKYDPTRVDECPPLGVGGSPKTFGSTHVISLQEINKISSTAIKLQPIHVSLSFLL